MDKLWSPWRSNYIESFKNKADDENDCVFCRAAKEDMNSDDSLVVYRGEHSFLMLNLYPYNSGHLMAIPNRHISDLLDLTDEETTEMMSLVKLSIKALKHLMKPQGFNMGANLGKAAGAGIHRHIHFHVLPRWNGDTNFMPAIGEVKVISQDLLVTKNNLIKAIEEVS